MKVCPTLKHNITHNYTYCKNCATNTDALLENSYYIHSPGGAMLEISRLNVAAVQALIHHTSSID